MARKIYITDEISIDDQLSEIADVDPVAALMWPWILTTFDDWARANASSRRLKTQVFPANDLVTIEKIEEALQLYHEKGLITLYEVEDKRYMFITTKKWYQWQTHIRAEKRERDCSHIPHPSEGCAQVRASARDSAQKKLSSGMKSKLTASPPPSPPPSSLTTLPPTPPPTTARTAKPPARVSYPEDFEKFWNIYPRKIQKKGAFRNWNSRLKCGLTPSEIVEAAKNYAAFHKAAGTQENFIKYPSTFLSGVDEPFEDYLHGTEEEWVQKGRNGNGTHKTGQQYRPSEVDWDKEPATLL